MASLFRVTLYERDGCHLCDEARVLLDEMIGPDRYDRVDIETDDALVLRYGFRVPVMALDGIDRLEAPITRSRPARSARRARDRLMAFRRTRRGSLVWAAGIAILVIVLGVLAAIPLLRGDGAGTQGTLVGKPAPAVAADDLHGRRWTLTDGADRIAWVNFWATNCEPCRTEMPAMQRLADAYGARLLVLGIDWGESQSSVEDFIDRYEISYPILLDPTLANFYRWSRLDGLPRHYFVDGDGTVVREVIGPLAPARMLEIVEDLIGPA